MHRLILFSNMYFTVNAITSSMLSQIEKKIYTLNNVTEDYLST